MIGIQWAYIAVLLHNQRLLWWIGIIFRDLIHYAIGSPNALRRERMYDSFEFWQTNI